MSRQQHFTPNLALLAALTFILTALFVVVLLGLIRNPQAFGRILYTNDDRANGYDAYVYNWMTGSQQPLPVKTVTDEGWLWKLDDNQTVFAETCLRVEAIPCASLTRGIFQTDDVDKLNNLNTVWREGYGTPIWSPDHRWILFGDREQRDMHLMSADGRAIRDLLPGSAPDGYIFNWSPDSRRIAFVGNNNRDLNILDLDDGHVQTIATLLSSIARIAWSPDSRQLALVSVINPRSDASEMVLVNRDGTQLVKVSGKALKYYLQPVWSPDGTQLAFSSLGGVYVVNKDGTDLRTLAHIHMMGAVAWSPDSRALAFYAGRFGETYLYIVDTDGHNLMVRLMQNYTFDGSGGLPSSLFWLS